MRLGPTEALFMNMPDDGGWMIRIDGGGTNPKRRRLLALACAILASRSARADPAEVDGEGGLDVQVSSKGAVVTMLASFTAPVGVRLAWEVMTDYDHMAQFLPHLESSRIVERRPGNRLLVEQRGEVPLGPLARAFSYVREVELHPYTELRSRVISGTVERADVTTQLFPKGAETRVVYRSEVVPGVWLPFGVGNAIIRRNLVEQLSMMRAEMVRRSSAG
jgi:hypothetical protein